MHASRLFSKSSIQTEAGPESLRLKLHTVIAASAAHIPKTALCRTRFLHLSLSIVSTCQTANSTSHCHCFVGTPSAQNSRTFSGCLVKARRCRHSSDAATAVASDATSLKAGLRTCLRTNFEALHVQNAYGSYRLWILYKSAKRSIGTCGGHYDARRARCGTPQKRAERQHCRTGAFGGYRADELGPVRSGRQARADRGGQAPGVGRS